MKIKAYKLNVFGVEENGGNPAGVVLDSENLKDKNMQEIAYKINFSETAFISKSQIADFKIRFFTPNSEIDLCGHACIGSFYLLKKLNLISLGEYSVETNIGVIKIHSLKNGNIQMIQPKPRFFEKINSQEIMDSLNLNQSSLNLNLPIQIVSTGLRDLFIPIKSLEILTNLNPDFNKIKSLSEKYNVTGYHVFTLETVDNSSGHCRNFAPLYDINEESATGTSSGALCCYLFKNNIKNLNNEYIFEQGYTMNKKSKIFCEINTLKEEIINVTVGGKASNIREEIITFSN